MTENTCVYCGRSVEKGTSLYEGRIRPEATGYFSNADFVCYQCQTLDELADKIMHDEGTDANTMQLFILALERLPDTSPFKQGLKEWWERKEYMNGTHKDDVIITTHTLTDDERAKFERENA